jgi:K+-transporting ATPase c subunit
MTETSQEVPAEINLEELLAQQKTALKTIETLRQTLQNIPAELVAEIELALGPNGTVQATQAEVKRIKAQMTLIRERMAKVDAKASQLAVRHAKALEEEQSKEDRLKAKEAK